MPESPKKQDTSEKAYDWNIYITCEGYQCISELPVKINPIKNITLIELLKGIIRILPRINVDGVEAIGFRVERVNHEPNK